VPAQVFELVNNKLSPPPSLRFIYVGGAYLNEGLYKKAVNLDWPMVITYGMTEAASSVATSYLADIKSKNIPKLIILDHLQASLTSDKTLHLMGGSLASIQVEFFASKEPKVTQFKKNEGIITQDVVDLKNKQVTFISRKNEQVKVGGELVNINQLNNNFEAFKLKNNMNQSSKIKPGFHYKYGNQIELHAEITNNIKEIENTVSQFNKNLTSYQKIKSIFLKNEIKKTTLNK